MKKTILVLLTVFAFNLTNAQKLVTSVYQNLDSEKIDVLTELDLLTKSGINFMAYMRFKANTNHKQMGFGVGYTHTNDYVSITPSLMSGINMIQGRDLFYGLDTDIDVKLTKNIMVTAKWRYNQSGGNKFALNNFFNTYFAGLKIKL